MKFYEKLPGEFGYLIANFICRKKKILALALLKIVRNSRCKKSREELRVLNSRGRAASSLFPGAAANTAARGASCFGANDDSRHKYTYTAASLGVSRRDRTYRIYTPVSHKRISH